MRRLVLLLAVVYSAPGSAAAQGRLDEIVVRVNAEIILKSEVEDFKRQLQREIEEQQKLTGAQLEQAVQARERDIIRDMIDNSLLLQTAKDMGLSADLEVIKTMERMRQEFKFNSLDELEKAIVQQGSTVEDFKQSIRTRYLTSQVISREVYPKIIITTEEVRKYYEEHKDEFDRPAGISLRQIVILTEDKAPEDVARARKKAEEALAEVKKGTEFSEVAQKYSEDQSAENGGNLGYFEKGQMAEDLEKATAKLEKGQTTDLLELKYGFVILKLDDKHDGGVLSFDLAQNEIQNRLFSSRAQPKIREYLTKLREDGFVEVREGYVDSGAAPKKPRPETKSNKDK